MPFIPTQRDPARSQVIGPARRWLEHPVTARSGQLWPRTLPAQALGCPPGTKQMWPRGTGVIGVPDVPRLPVYTPPPTTPTTVEVANGTAGALTQNPTVVITGPVQPGDVLIVVAQTQTTMNAAVTLSGCGAKWTQAAIDGGVGQSSFVVFVGVGATSAGTITLDLISTGHNGFIRAWLIRGVNNPASFSAWATGGGILVNAAATFTTLPLTVGSNQYALTVMGGTSTNLAQNLYFSSTSPASGWSADPTLTTSAGIGSMQAAQHYLGTAQGTVLTANYVNNTSGQRFLALVQVVLGDATDPIHRVGQYSWDGTVSGGSLKLPQTPTPGNLLIAAARATAEGATFTMAAYTWAVGPRVANVSGSAVQLFYKVADGRDAAPQINVAGAGSADCFCSEWAGLIGPGVFDVAGSGATATTQTGTLTDSLTTSAAGLIFSIGYAKAAGTNTMTWGGGMVEDLPIRLSFGSYASLGFGVFGSGGARSPSVAYSSGATTPWHALMATVAFKGA